MPSTVMEVSVTRRKKKTTQAEHPPHINQGKRATLTIGFLWNLGINLYRSQKKQELLGNRRRP
jgi:hypothetical protein